MLAIVAKARQDTGCWILDFSRDRFQTCSSIEFDTTAFGSGEADFYTSIHKIPAAAVQAANTLEAYQPAGTSLVEHYKFRVDNPDLVPRELCSPDSAKIRGYLKLHKASAEIPGVAIWREDTVRQTTGG